MSVIKAICFDLDGVYFTPRGKASFITALNSEFGGDVEACGAFMTSSPEMRNLALGHITPTNFWHALRAATGISATDDELTARWIRDYEIDESVRDVVINARRAGYKTCVCTNNNAIRLPALEERFHFYQDFDVIVSSHEAGFVKPTQEIFQILLDRLDIESQELIYADDNPDRLDGAKRLGITTFVYESFEQFTTVLKQNGIDL